MGWQIKYDSLHMKSGVAVKMFDRSDLWGPFRGGGTSGFCSLSIIIWKKKMREEKDARIKTGNRHGVL